MPTSTVRGIRMRWEETGEGAPVILLHGIPTSPALWRKVMPLVRDARLLAWEMVGYGESIREGRGRDIGVARQARYLRAWLDEQGIERAVLAGHDLGGGVAQIFAVENPERTAGLVLTNAICYDSWPIPSVKAMRAMGGLVEKMPKAAFEPIVAGFLRLGHDDADIAKESTAIHWRPYAEHDGAAAFIRQIRSLDVNDTLRIADKLGSLRVPARVVWGTSDNFQEIRFGERLAWDLDTPLERIEGGKHFTPEDHPERIAKAIQDVLDEPRVPNAEARRASREARNVQV